MMTRYSKVSYEAPFDEVSARDCIRSGKDFFWHGTSFRSDLNLTFEDNGGLSVPRLGTDTLAKTALLLAKLLASKSRKGKKEQATMSPSHQFQSTKNPSSTTIVVQKRGTKRSSDMQYEDTLVVSYDDASKDSGANWKHIRKSSKGSSTMTLADHVPTSTHNEPSIVNLETKKHRVDNSITSPKPVNDTNKVSSQQEQGMSMSKQGALMLGDLLLSQILDFPLNKIFPKDEVSKIYHGIQNFGIDPQPLQVHVDKYLKDVSYYIEKEASMSNHVSLEIQTRYVNDTELLITEASSRKESLDAKLQITNSEIDDMKEKLAELEQLVPQIKSKQVEEDGIIEALEDQLKSIKSTTVLKDQDLEALKKIQSTLESKRSDLKNLKWML
nr:hypothetical protein CFP56_23726 [Quercus suber]